MQSRFEEAFWPGLSISSNLGAQSYRNSNRIFEVEESTKITENKNYYDNHNSTKNDGQMSFYNRNNLNLMFSPSYSESTKNQNYSSNWNKSTKQKDSDSKMKTTVPQKWESSKYESKTKNQDDQNSNLSSTRAPLSKHEGNIKLGNY